MKSKKINRKVDMGGKLQPNAQVANINNSTDPEKPTNILLDDELKPIIRYKRYLELIEEIRKCQEQTRLAGESCCMAIEGEPGAGKSTLVKDYVASFPHRETETGDEIPVLYVKTPSPVTVKGMASFMLKELGDPIWDKGSQTQLEVRLVGLVKDCKVEVVVIDDFNHLIDLETQHILNKVANWLKVVIKETEVTFVVVSITGKVDLILEENQQLSRLFLAPFVLNPFQWDTNERGTIDEFNSFVDFIEKTRLPLHQDLPREETLRRIFYATRGLVANIVNLFNMATSIAQYNNEKEICMGYLKEACDKRLMGHAKLRVNPFANDTTLKFVAPDPPYWDHNPKSTKHGKGNKKAREADKSI